MSLKAPELIQMIAVMREIFIKLNATPRDKFMYQT